MLHIHPNLPITGMIHYLKFFFSIGSIIEGSSTHRHADYAVCTVCIMLIHYYDRYPSLDVFSLLVPFFIMYLIFDLYLGISVWLMWSVLY
ncbi:hypothetical protein B9Z19DRAFT_1084654 [Tuber borchii]|uniref:Uncharacterized protein n=1 Tax=Tuber borchii TaxID=42251 RepID=A0A2T6ZRM5_TUBBO|nr:hypothetical protein B9Z19DRAFT_1084654 [Tuber borchii]